MRLIDADALKEELNSWAVDLTKSKFPHYIKDDADCIIDTAPTIDAMPVRHGRWEKNDYLFLDTLYRCSVCGEEFYLENGTPQENQYYYCPNCGAKMDGEK